jgi:hypothetical protein
MGGSIREKQEAMVAANEAFLQKFAERSKEVEAKLAVPVPPVCSDFMDYEGFFVRDKESFSLKTKSKNRDKQRLEFVRHVFHLYPVPDFMFQAWEIPRPGPGHYRYRSSSDFGFATKDDYRLWYICVATGGSFYKEYGQHLFTKKECHIFLNCQHDLTIPQAMVYAVAYAESQNMGLSLRIAKSKLSSFVDTLTLTEFWREIIRFFARQNPASKEVVDDTLDYIIYKREENPEFTILGKGHTLESLSKKVEKWHQDLRRLKLIGEQVWEGIPLPDKEYTKKNRDDTVSYWKFTQIKSAKVLQQEGNAMRHCVLTYKRGCINKECSIWSVTFDEQRKLTLELRNHQIVQVRGLANRLARPDEEAVIKRWAKDNGLYYK